ncbi:MAG TPA: histidine--tRNA ligase [Myxococcaceae bacterium]|nr:histidine--tRNA ligase [Myxococcaceae bacterium]
MSRVAGVKGMNDLLPPDSAAWEHLESIVRSLCHRYGYRELRTPVLEDTALFVRSVGEATDIVGKEMYTFEDKAGRSLSLRPEGTAPAARAYIEHAVANREPVTRWFYMGPMFRYERMKTGRYRQFHQLGLEGYGAEEPAVEVEQMELVVELLRGLGLRDITLHINSLGDEACRPAFQASLVGYLRDHRESLCADCQVRLEKNPLRVLDCKNPGCQQVAAGAPSILDALCPDCEAHFAEVQRKLTLLEIPFKVDARIMRGLDYYTRTTFEFIAADPVLGTASTVGGGGRYDRLIKQLGGPQTPAVGLALGLERLVLLMEAGGSAHVKAPDLFVATAEPVAADPAFTWVSRLRRAGVAVEFDPRGGSLKSQLKRADKSGATWALVLGGAELESGQAALKPLRGGEPEPVRLDDLAEVLRAKRTRTG